VAATAPSCCSCMGIPQHEPHSLLLLLLVVMVCEVCLQRIRWVCARHADSSSSSSTRSRRRPYPAADRRDG
jgi:hypothetical protein